MEVRCADGRVLGVRPVPVRDRSGAPYEVTLDLLLDGAPFGAVGERSAGALQALAHRLAGGAVGTAERGVRAWAAARGQDPDAAWQELRPHLPRDAELLALTARDPDDVSAEGELRVLLRPVHAWDDGWSSRTDVVLQAWGEGGTGVRAVLDLDGLRALLAALLAEVAAATARDEG